MSEPRTDLWTSIRRCLGGRCPSCGDARLFASYLKQVERCAACGERLGHIRADDAPPWLTILIVGHIVLPLAFAVEPHAPWPHWVAMSLWPSLAALMSLLVLPRAKALFIGIIWSTRAPGSEDEGVSGAAP